MGSPDELFLQNIHLIRETLASQLHLLEKANRESESELAISCCL